MFYEAIHPIFRDYYGLYFSHPEYFDGKSDYRVILNWVLEETAEEPEKTSKSIMITISREAVVDFKESAEEVQKSALRRLEQLLREKLAGFEPRHDSPPEAESPTERWIIKTEHLLGR